MLQRLEKSQLLEEEARGVARNNSIKANATRSNKRLGKLISKHFGDDTQTKIDIRTRLQELSKQDKTKKINLVR